jgi:hypothetical protein
MNAKRNEAAYVAFKEWAADHLGQGYSLEMEDGSFTDKVTRWAFIAYKAGLAARSAEVSTKSPVPLAQIGIILEEVMKTAAANGANSVSMPDEYVAVAHFLCYPDEYLDQKT